MKEEAEEEAPADDDDELSHTWRGGKNLGAWQPILRGKYCVVFGVWSVDCDLGKKREA
jgi:hypothetical protein